MSFGARQQRIGRRRRSGYALVELIVVISVNSVLMAVAAGLIGSLLRTERQGQRHCEQTGALVRLADQFREDAADAHQAAVVSGGANAAAAAEAGPSLERLRLSGPDERMIEYSRDGERIRRIEYQKQAVVRREAYKVIDLAEAGFAVADNQIVSLRLRLSDEANAARDVWRIEARLARHGRFATGRQP